jgi:hypothetical protein
MEALRERQIQLARLKAADNVQRSLEENGFGFPLERIRATVLEPDDTSVVRRHGRTIIEICAKHHRERTEIAGIGVGGDTWEAMFGLQAYPDLDEGPLEELTPLQIVERIAERFGLPMTIAGKSDKFFLEREFLVSKTPRPVVPYDWLITPHNPADRPYMLVKAAKADCIEGKGVVALVLLAFCIDSLNYRRWVRNR